MNAAVYTVDENRSWAEAVAIDAGAIVFVGSAEDALAFVGAGTEVIDLSGAMILPGFHDMHTHLLIGMPDEAECNLLRLESVAEIRNELERCARYEGLGDERWVIGTGWAEWLFPDGNPDKSMLDEIFPHRPVYLDASFGHSIWVNSRALELAGVSAETPDPPIGMIVRDPASGDPTGTLHEGAMSLVKQALPSLSRERQLRRIRTAIDTAHSFGITAVIEPGMDRELVAPLASMADAEDLDIRALVSLSPLGFTSDAFDESVFDLLEERDELRGRTSMSILSRSTSMVSSNPGPRTCWSRIWIINPGTGCVTTTRKP